MGVLKTSFRRPAYNNSDKNVKDLPDMMSKQKMLDTAINLLILIC